MYFYRMNDVILAARVFHSSDISELVEATTLDAQYVPPHSSEEPKRSVSTRDTIGDC